MGWLTPYPSRHSMLKAFQQTRKIELPSALPKSRSGAAW
jgi:hypothetical protein